MILPARSFAPLAYPHLESTVSCNILAIFSLPYVSPRRSRRIAEVVTPRRARRCMRAHKAAAHKVRLETCAESMYVWRWTDVRVVVSPETSQV